MLLHADKSTQESLSPCMSLPASLPMQYTDADPFDYMAALWRLPRHVR